MLWALAVILLAGVFLLTGKLSDVSAAVSSLAGEKERAIGIAGLPEDSIVKRLEQLEDQSRRLKCSAIVFLAVACLALLMGLARPNQRTVEAERFVLKDHDGKTRAELYVEPEGSGLRLYDAKGKAQARLGGDPEGVSLVFFGKPTIEALFGVTSDGGASLELNEPNGRKRIALEVDQKEPMLTFYDSDGKASWHAP